ncbi:polysaccharide biosynthesis tyrosine autokinase [Bosea sp. (in: a-proteobacteria)]|uniref:GumC family protein n=1 Tax=Bosea sp. (in: a-proteobacteria) TaxID=1871050 RepID=UPI00262CE16D|nr:polysaccharide biosynthesis tyrosine autokinase [Bosea sp. (in: a-proteobacteria)]MCO5090968.1 polysaccharide biosynthesis tyrosine autokinase [Bosea sp. (in: a-proteobacteria)]
MDFFSEIRTPRQPPALSRHYDTVTFDFVSMLWRRRGLILAITCAAMLVAVLALMLMPRRYATDLVMQFDFTREETGAAGGKSSSVALDASTLVESEARIIRSLATARAVVLRLNLDRQPVKPSFLSRLVASAGEVILPSRVRSAVRDFAGLSETPNPQALRDSVAQGLLASLTVGNDTKAYLITLTYRDTDPDRAARIVNAFGSEYLRRKMEATTSASQRSSRWYGVQAREARINLARIEKEIEQFRVRTGFVELGQDGADVQQQQLRDVLTQVNAASATRLAEEMRLRRAQESIAAGHVPQATDLGGSPVVQALLDEEGKARRALDEMIGMTGERHPAVARLRLTLNSVQDRLKNQLAQSVANIETDVEAARAAEAALSARVATLQAKSIEARGLEGQLRTLQAEATAARDRVKQLADAQQQASAVSELKPVVAQILAPAEIPSLPSTPGPALVLGLGLLGGLAAGASLSYMLEKRDRGFRSESEFAVENHGNCVGLLPKLERYPDGLEGLVFVEAVRSTVAELFSPTKPPKVVLITSSAPGEGKSLVASAMARVLAAMGQRVLVVDGSPRRLLLGENFPHEALLDRCFPHSGDAAAAAAPVATVRRASGLRDGQNVYSNPAFEAMLHEARTRYDVILFEVAPVLLSADCALLREHADTVLHVVKWNDTLRTTVSATLDHLARLGLDVGGIVLNGVDLEEQGRYNTPDRGRVYRSYKSFYQASA